MVTKTKKLDRSENISCLSKPLKNKSQIYQITLKLLLKDNNGKKKNKTNKKVASKKSKKNNKKKITKKDIDEQAVVFKQLETKLKSLVAKSKQSKNKDKLPEMKKDYKKTKKLYDEERKKYLEMKKEFKGSSFTYKPITNPFSPGIWKQPTPTFPEDKLTNKILETFKGSSLSKKKFEKKFLEIVDVLESDKDLKDIEGEGLKDLVYQKIANAYRKLFCNGKARKLYEGELHPLCSNWCGPGTRVDKQDVLNTKPYNDVDNVCKTHDLDYAAANKEQDGGKRSKRIREADEKMLKELEKYKKQEPYYTMARLAISGKMKVEDLLPWLSKKISPEHFGRKQ